MHLNLIWRTLSLPRILQELAYPILQYVKRRKLYYTLISINFMQTYFWVSFQSESVTPVLVLNSSNTVTYFLTQWINNESAGLLNYLLRFEWRLSSDSAFYLSINHVHLIIPLLPSPSTAAQRSRRPWRKATQTLWSSFCKQALIKRPSSRCDVRTQILLLLACTPHILLSLSKDQNEYPTVSLLPLF